MQPSILVAHASKRGSTEEVAAFVAKRLRERGLVVDLRPAELDVGGYGHRRCLVCRGSNASRMPSPMKFAVSAIRMIIRPGK